jgi:phage terminase Nu1 subunit (DNA packaging protein)
VIEVVDLIEVLKQKYPDIMEEDVDFIFEYIFENRDLG